MCSTYKRKRVRLQVPGFLAAKVMFLQVSVIHSVHRGGGGLPQCMLGYPPDQADTPQDQTPPGPGRHPPRSDTPPGPGRHPPSQDQADPPPREADSSIRSTSGRYASYWNAFLFLLKITTDYNPKIKIKSRREGTSHLVARCAPVLPRRRSYFRGQIVFQCLKWDLSATGNHKVRHRLLLNVSSQNLLMRSYFLENLTPKPIILSVR